MQNGCIQLVFIPHTKTKNSTKDNDYKTQKNKKDGKIELSKLYSDGSYYTYEIDNNIVFSKNR